MRILFLGDMQVRSHVEKQIDLIAQGQAEKEAVVAHTLDQVARKFRYFVGRINRMDALFEASFSPLASSGETSLLLMMAPHQKNDVKGPCCDICNWHRRQAAEQVRQVCALHEAHLCAALQDVLPNLRRSSQPAPGAQPRHLRLTTHSQVLCMAVKYFQPLCLVRCHVSLSSHTCHLTGSIKKITITPACQPQKEGLLYDRPQSLRK